MSQPDPATASATSVRNGIDPRGPRFGAAITATLLIVALFLALLGANLAATVITGIVVASFAWGAIAGVQRHPYGLTYRALVRPRLKPLAELEDAAPPRFAQAVGLVITGLGLVLQLVGVPGAIATATALAFIAAFLNAAFGYCLGCQIYLLLVRFGAIRRSTETA